MSKVAIVGDASGTGTFTISAPNGNTDRTLVLPDEAGTIITTAGVPASAMPAGSVLQVKSQRISTQTTNTSNSVWADVGFSLSITPISTNSKILVTAYINASNRTDGLGEDFRLKRNGTVIETQLQFNQAASPMDASPSTNGMGSVQTYYFYDSPASTSAQTYTIEFKHRDGNSGYFTINYGTGSARSPVYSNLQLMEVAG